MKLKLDENLSNRTLTVLQRAGHDVTTVVQQNLSGISTSIDYAGIAVLRVPSPLSYQLLLNAILTLALETESLSGNLWIVEIGRIRVYLPKDK
jgi:hypothetical protein